jgi:predicted permease
MDIIGILIANILPLYILIALGYIAGRWLDVNLPSMATIAIYIIAPIVNFGAMAKLEFTPGYISLPVVFFIVSALIGMATYKIATAIWKNNNANLIAMSSVTGNTGYFGLPLVLALFGPQWVGVYMLMNLGVLLNEIGLGYYFGARGHADVKGALMKVIKLPVIHAIWLGLVFNMLDFPLPDVFTRYWTFATGAWVFIGMMLIGVALSKQPRLELDGRLMRWMFASKFIVWPLIGAGIIAGDHFIFHIFDPVIYSLVAIFTSVPLAGNLVAFAANLNLHPERTAGAVLVSTVLALGTVPVAVLITGSFFN